MSLMQSRVVVILPLYNARNYLSGLMPMLLAQSLQVVSILCSDSSSSDGTVALLRQYPVEIKVITKAEFDHAKTREYATTLIDADVYVFLTQDVILSDEYALENIIKCFDDEEVGCAYGRQLPHADASVLASHTRDFNYPAQSSVKSVADIEKYGIKTCFNSNSFSAYRKTAFIQTGGFPERMILGEDMYCAAKMLLAGWKVAYCAEARVYHSHNYTPLQEFKRYFDIGVSHRDEKWILDAFNSPNSEGRRFVLSELTFCVKRKAYFTIYRSICTSFCKWLGYKFGWYYKVLPNWLRKKMSMHAYHWKR